MMTPNVNLRRATAAEGLDGATAPIRPVPFWSWNERLDPAELRRQIDLFDLAGWGGAFLHARVGLTTPYLGDDWFTAVDAATDACDERGLSVWLYDEDRWPSGFSGGSVPLADRTYRMSALVARRAGGPTPPDVEPLVREGDLVVYQWTAPLNSPWFNGTCQGDLLGEEAMRRFVADAYGRYADHLGGRCGDVVTSAFTDEPSPIFRLGLPRGAVPWSPDLPRVFVDHHGYDPVPLLPLLFLNKPRAARFRVHYFEAVNVAFGRHFVEPIASFCRDHGLRFVGHLMSEHGLYDQQLWGTSVMRHYRHFDLPGIDHLARQTNETLTAIQCRSVANQFGKRGVLSELYGVAGQNLSFADRWWIGCQQVALGVTQFVPHLALYTMAGVRKRDYPPNLFYQQPWWPLNRVVDGPLARLCGLMSEGRPAVDVVVLHPQETAWALWRSDPEPDEPAADDARDFEPTAAGVKAEIEQYDEALKHVLSTLLAAQVPADLADEALLAEDAAHDRRRLRVGEMRYRVVIVPSMLTIRRTTLDLLEQLLADGGHVLMAGEPPALLDGEPSDGPAAVLADAERCDATTLAAAVRRRVPPAVVIDGLPDGAKQRTLVNVRDLPDGRRRVFVTNLNRHVGGTATVTCAGPWSSASLVSLGEDAQTEIEVERLDGGVRFKLPLASTEAHVIDLAGTHVPANAPDARGRPRGYKQDDDRERSTLIAEEWSVERLDDNALPLDTAWWREGGDESRHRVPVVAIQHSLNERRYDGPLTLRFGFEVEAPLGGNVRLVVEYPERWRISVNGRTVSYDGLPAWRDVRWMPIDIAEHVRPGTNRIELHADAFRHGDLCSTQDHDRRYGTEAEAVYVVGDFDVAADTVAWSPANPRWAEYDLPAARQYQVSRPRLVNPAGKSAGNVVPQGLPFYAGRLRYTTHLPRGDLPRLLRLEELDAAVAKVSLGGQTVGYVYREPFELRLPAGSEGELSITLYGTLRNLLGPHHHPEGELAAVAPPMFEPAWPAGSSVAEAVAAWGAGASAPGDWCDAHGVVSFGRIGSITLTTLEADA